MSYFDACIVTLGLNIFAYPNYSHVARLGFLKVIGYTIVCNNQQKIVKVTMLESKRVYEEGRWLFGSDWTDFR